MRSQLCLVVACLLTSAFAYPEALYNSFDALEYRALKAAKSHADVLRRSDDIVTKKAIVLTYADDANYVDGTTFASRVRLGGDRETLFLEEFDHLLNVVECSASSMTLEFRDPAFFAKAKNACSALHNGLVVASHSSCSEIDAHSVFDITSISFDEENSRILLGTKETSWLKSYRTKKIEFGQTPDRHYLHQHNRLSRRQAKPTSTSTALHVVSAAVSLVPTATPTEESVTFDLSNDQNETTFSLPGGISVGPPLPITVGCKRCTTKGQLILTQGEIDFVDLDDIRPQNFRDFDFIESGFFQLQLNGFESSILLRAIPSVSASLAYDLYTLPVRGFKIKGIGAAGLLFQPQIAFDISVKGGVELTWGFKVNVPDKSTIRIDIGDFNKSGVVGFDKTTVSSLPFNVNASDIELGLRAGLRPFLPIGMTFFKNRLKLLGGPFLDLPFIDTTVTQLASSGVNSNCETGKGNTNSKFQDAFKNLTHIQASLGIGVGFEVEAKADLPLLPDVAVRKDFNIWSTTTPLPTACLAWSKETGMAIAVDVEKKIIEDEKKASDEKKGNVGASTSFGSFRQLAMLAVCALIATTTAI